MVDIHSITISSPFKMLSFGTMLTIQRTSKPILSYYIYYIFTTVYTDVVIVGIFMLRPKKHFLCCIEWRLSLDLKTTPKGLPCCHTHHEEIHLQRIVSHDGTRVQKPHAVMKEQLDRSEHRCSAWCSRMHVAWSLAAALAALKNVLAKCGWMLGSGFSSSLAVPALPWGVSSMPHSQPPNATPPIQFLNNDWTHPSPIGSREAEVSSPRSAIEQRGHKGGCTLGPKRA